MQTVADPAAGARRVKEALCPRCGYDVSGEIETWKDSCPVIGRCSECGVRFRWLHALRPDWCDADDGVATWSFEQGDRATVWRLLRTSMRLLVPERFFGGLCKHHMRRGQRVAALTMFWAGVYGISLTGPMLVAWLYRRPEIFGVIFNLRFVVELFWRAWPLWLGSLLVPLAWMLTQVWFGAAIARRKQVAGIGLGDAWRLVVYGFSGLLMLNAGIVTGIWALIFGQFIRALMPVPWIGILLGVVWSLVVLVQWWPLALANFYHCRRGGMLRWAPPVVGLVSGASIGVTIYVLWA